jgi:hypothetical protein
MRETAPRILAESLNVERDTITLRHVQTLLGVALLLIRLRPPISSIHVEVSINLPPLKVPMLYHATDSKIVAQPVSMVSQQQVHLVEVHHQTRSLRWIRLQVDLYKY